jgi:hypothetical protein
MKFVTRKKAHWSISILLVFLTVSGLGAITFCLYSLFIQHRNDYLMAGVFGFVFLITGFILFIQSYAWYTAYYVLNDSLDLRGVYSKGKILYHDIQSIRALSVKEARDIIDTYMQETTKHETEMDLSGWYKSGKRYSNFSKYCTYQFIHKHSGPRPHLVEYKGSIVSGDFVLLRLVNCNEYLLSPVDVDGFVDSVNQHLSGRI